MEILLVDDERLACACTQSMLEEILSGVEVRFHHASTAAQALEWLEDRGAPDLAIVDYKMPKCSGLELVERAGPCCPGTVWVLLSGYDLADERSRIEAAGVRFTLSKPAGVEEFSAVVSHIWGNGGAMP